MAKAYAADRCPAIARNRLLSEPSGGSDLALPREPSADRGVPFNQVPHN